RAIIG
ncbi:hypothetical protein VC116059_003136B, partial [Vibrio cholerae O1 str. 116059]